MPGGFVTTPDDFMAQLRAAYPKRDGGNGWPIAESKIRAALAGGADWETMLKGTVNYAKFCQRKGWLGSGFVQQARTYYGPGQWWLEYAEMDMRTPAEIAAERARDALVQRALRIGFRQPHPGEPDFRYQDALAEAERQASPRGEPKRFGVVR
jgi:hypothetical protein